MSQEKIDELDDLEKALSFEIKGRIEELDKVPLIMNTAFKDYYVLIEEEQAIAIIEALVQAFGYDILKMLSTGEDEDYE